MAQTGAELLVESLVAAGVKHLFSLSGNQILSVYDAAIGREVAIIHTRHEAAAVHMADAWGRLTEEPGVALLTAGPGHANAMTALYVARMAESPVVLLSGHSPLAQRGRGAFQEMDQVGMAQPVSKAAWLAQDASRIGEDISRALAIARSGRPGPVHISLPGDLLEAKVGAPAAKPTQEYESAPALPADEQLHAILEQLAVAKNPLMLVGPAMARASRWADVARLADGTGVPALPVESPRGVNDPWLRGATACLTRADVALLIGKSLDFSLRFGRPPVFAPSCRFIQIDADAEQLRAHEQVTLAIHAEPSAVVRRLGALAGQHKWTHEAWRGETEAARAAVPTEWHDLRSDREPIHPLAICTALQAFLKDDAVLICDGGEFGQWAQGGLEARTRLINGPAGAIGGAAPMALAAKLAHPHKTVFALSGDGSFGYHAMEFDTAVRYNLPIIAIVGNDARWNAEYQLQIQNYGAERTIGCELRLSRYDQVVEALGGYGEFVQHPDDLAPAIGRAVASGLPACINVAIEGVAAPVFRR